MVIGCLIPLEISLREFLLNTIQNQSKIKILHCGLSQIYIQNQSIDNFR